MKKTYLIGGVIALAVVVVFLVWNSSNQTTTNSTSDPASQKSVSSIQHAHGLAVDVADSSKVYIATHQGLVVLQNDADLYQVGESTDDFMGFTAHPTDSNMFFSSGHPSKGGGNLGFQKSDDKGVSWQKVSSGSGGPIDFHAMVISPVNPNILYGWYHNELQISSDQGKTWEIVDTALANVISLTADTQDEQSVYAATTNGLMKSIDQGKNWLVQSSDIGTVTALAIHPQNSKMMLAFSQQRGLLQSTDGGNEWISGSERFGGDIVLYIAFDQNTPTTVYALSKSNTIYKSTDEGKSWKKIR
jgi:photosystem II stability/assembly factor-like uncharacterized protein